MKTSPGKFIEQGLSNTIWAAATLKLDKAEIEPIVAAVVERMKTSPGKFQEQGLSNMKTSPGKFSEQGLSTTLLAATRFQLYMNGVAPIGVTVRILLTKGLNKQIKQQISNITWPVVQADHAATLVAVVLAEVAQRIAKSGSVFSLQGLADIVTCCATYGRCDPFLLNEVAEEVVRRGPGLSGDDLLIGLARIIS
eukprot:6169580-Amphidinium_carterae.1